MDSGIHPYTCNHYCIRCKITIFTESINDCSTYWKKFFSGKKKKKKDYFRKNIRFGKNCYRSNKY